MQIPNSNPVGPVFGVHPSPGAVRFWVVVSDPANLGENVLLVHSDILDWGHEGWAATLRRTSTHIFEGWWGANFPDFNPGTVPHGMHHVVLAVSGEADEWVGWQANLHANAGVDETVVHVMPGVETLVKLWLTLGTPPTYTEPFVSTSRPTDWPLSPTALPAAAALPPATTVSTAALLAPDVANSAASAAASATIPLAPILESATQFSTVPPPAAATFATYGVIAPQDSADPASYPSPIAAISLVVRERGGWREHWWRIHPNSNGSSGEGNGFGIEASASSSECSGGAGGKFDLPRARRRLVPWGVRLRGWGFPLVGPAGACDCSLKAASLRSRVARLMRHS